MVDSMRSDRSDEVVGDAIGRPAGPSGSYQSAMPLRVEQDRRRGDRRVGHREVTDGDAVLDGRAEAAPRRRRDARGRPRGAPAEGAPLVDEDGGLADVGA